MGQIRSVDFGEKDRWCYSNAITSSSVYENDIVQPISTCDPVCAFMVTGIAAVVGPSELILRPCQSAYFFVCSNKIF